MASLQDILTSPRTRRPIVMGILNVTPDSFSDGGEFYSPDAAIRQAERMIEQGADILDLGAESTRPGSQRVRAEEQIDRLKPVLHRVCQLASAAGVAVSIDTTRATVAEFAIGCGAQMVNDISAGREDPDLLPLVAADGAVGVVLMHMLGEPATMQVDPHYDDVVEDVRSFLADRIAAAVAAGVGADRVIVDPGIGFGKTLDDNLALLRGTDRLVSLGVPVLVGPSRKRFIGELTGEKIAADRLGGTIAACLEACRRGATIFRVHDVGPVRQALDVARALA